MATLVLSAAGMALGGSVGGSVLGLSMATIGRAAGATLGRVIDQRLLGQGSEAVETGRVDRFRLTSAAEGAPIKQVFGRMRVPGQVIWATQFQESKTTTGGGKGQPARPKTTEFTYTVSVAIALCQDEISHVGRIWADGEEIAANELTMRVYHGTQDQLPDPKIVATEGPLHTPAYRGTAYVVLEDLALGRFGNRLPQFTFEVMRPSARDENPATADLAHRINGVALIPGTGEYGLATAPVYQDKGFAEKVAINVNTPSGLTDFDTSLNNLAGELPACKSALLVVSWFGNDLRCGHCEVRPKVEQHAAEADIMPWYVAGIDRATALAVPQQAGRPVYGGTPTDTSVIQAIRAMVARGIEPVFYPFILMDQQPNNGLPNPWDGTADQPAYPWRGRITTSVSPTLAGTTDGTAAAENEVAQFMGTAAVSDFSTSADVVSYTGPAAWGYRRFILHYAHLCAAAGGVSAFCIGSEMRSLTHIRGQGGHYPAVDALVTLASDVRTILGPACKISYAADWSEYHGHQPAGTADKIFHLDPLWSSPDINFIGIDNYMPLSDWRDGNTHLDHAFGAIYNLDYLSGNVAGGEGYDWYYHSPEARDAQIRTAITDGEAEPWVWRYKDIEGWWSHQHRNRIGGVRQEIPTPWEPKSKPIWFTEFGCAAIDKGTNQPNKFLDPKSSESQLPHYSNGRRDDYMQMQYLRAVFDHYAKPDNNPVSPEYAGPMVDMSRAHVWAWDARPFPFFPATQELWSDGDNYARGHWLNGRASARTLASVVSEICAKSGVTAIDVTGLHGVVRGYCVDDISSARAALQPLITAYGIEIAEQEGALVFSRRDGRPQHRLGPDALALDPERPATVTLTREPAAEIIGRLQLGFVDFDHDYAPAVAETQRPDNTSAAIAQSEIPLAITASEAQTTLSRWLHEADVATDKIAFALPPSHNHVHVGDVVTVDTDDHKGDYRIDRLDHGGLRLAEGTRVDAEVYHPAIADEQAPTLRRHYGPAPVTFLMLDLPLLPALDDVNAPLAAATAVRWPGSVALYASQTDSNYNLLDVIRDRTPIGRLTAPLLRGPTGVWDRQSGVAVKMVTGQLQSLPEHEVFAGGNTIAIGDGTSDNWEIVQFAQSQPLDVATFELSNLLRGQAGTSSLIPDIWPVGSYVVVLDGTATALRIPSAVHRLDRYYRYGPLFQPLGDPSYQLRIDNISGNAARPYPVSHLRADDVAGDMQLTWIRGTRKDGDRWDLPDVPLHEETESYQVSVIQSGIVKRQETVSHATWTYPQAAKQADVGNSAFAISVAQISATYGAGSAVAVTFEG